MRDFSIFIFFLVYRLGKTICADMFSNFSRVISFGRKLYKFALVDLVGVLS